MGLKSISRIKINIFIVLMIIITAIFQWRDYEKYKMYVYVRLKEESIMVDPLAPWIKTWFNAKRWLIQDKYIRANDDKRFIIDTDGVFFSLTPSNKDKFLKELYVSMKLAYPKLKDQPLDEFYSHLQSLIFEYLFSKFNQTLTAPCIHFYVVSFIYKEQYFETIMDWDEENNNLNIWSYDFETKKDKSFERFFLTYKKETYRSITNKKGIKPD